MSLGTSRESRSQSSSKPVHPTGSMTCVPRLIRFCALEVTLDEFWNDRTETRYWVVHTCRMYRSNNRLSETAEYELPDMDINF